jgi:hypothetical protein
MITNPNGESELRLISHGVNGEPFARQQEDERARIRESSSILEFIFIVRARVITYLLVPYLPVGPISKSQPSNGDFSDNGNVHIYLAEPQ